MSLLIRDRKQEVLVAVVLIKTVTYVRLNSTIRTSDFMVQLSVLEVFLFSYQLLTPIWGLWEVFELFAV